MDARSTVELDVLGALRARAGGAVLDLGPPQRRTVLAVLICGARQVIPTERLLECVWDEHAGTSALGSLQVHVSRLRKELGREVIVRHPHGYELEIRPDQLDADVFSRWVRRGRSLIERGQLRPGRDLLGVALSLWRGRPFDEFGEAWWARPEIVRLEAARLGALEARLDADVELGDTDVLGELQALAVEHPLHEGFCGRLMLALYRSGRQSEALLVARRHRHDVVDATGLEPTPWLAGLEFRILHHDRRLRRPRRAAGELRMSATSTRQASDKTTTRRRQGGDKERTSAGGHAHCDHVREEHM